MWVLLEACSKTKSLPIELWGEAINTCVYVLNRSSTKSLQGRTPYEMWRGEKPKLSHLRIFGSILHLKTLGTLGKLEDRSKEMVFVGYEGGTKGYRYFNPTTHNVHLSRDVIFDEGRKWNFMERQPSEGMELCVSGVNHGFDNPNMRMKEDRDNLEGVFQDMPSNKASQGEGLTLTSNKVIPRFRSVQALYEATDPIEEEYLISFEELATYSKASEDEVWRKAMEEEITSIKKNDTGTLLKALISCKPISVKSVYKLKKNPLGKILKHKERLVVKGYDQIYRIDYDEVFAPIARFESIRSLIALAAQECWSLHHLDVKSAFFNGEIKEEIYVSQNKGYVKEGKEEWVLKLNKALYGLKQAPRTWNEKLDDTLTNIGFMKIKNDQGVYH